MWLNILRSSVLLVLLFSQKVTAVRRLPHDVLNHYPNNNETTRILKNVNVPLPNSPEDHLVTSLPFLSESDFQTRHYAGLLPANFEKTKYFFYWLFQYDDTNGAPVEDEQDIPLLLWLNGGPGCSSMDGLFLEHGPFRLQALQNDWKIKIHKQSWHTAPAYVVYVDQPVGTGLSFTTANEYPSNDEAVNRDFYHWLQEFLLLHANVFLNEEKTALKRPLYFSGESHAGHYIPSMMNYIHQQNDELKIRVSGAAIGNGWTDPYHQYAGAEAAYGHGLIDLAQKQALDVKEKDCQEEILKGNYHYRACLGLLDDIVSQSEGKTGQYRISQYDARNWERKHSDRTFPPGHKQVEAYLGGWQTPKDDPSMNGISSQVLKAIHATPSNDAGQRYQECTDPPYNALAHQDALGVVDDVVALLEDDVKLLFFNGLEDLICNHVGNEVMLMKLPWEHRDHWIEAKRYSWTAAKQSEVSGYVKEFENLSFLKILHSGHMVPMDVPDVALDMMKIFMYGKSFESTEQDLAREKEEAAAECPACPTCPDTTNTGTSPSATLDNDDEGSNANKDEESDGDFDDSNGVMQYVVAHSWLGAILAVSVFLGAFLYVRRRQQRVPGVATSYGNLEMKSNQRYRDDDEESYHDEEEEAVETNGNGII